MPALGLEDRHRVEAATAEVRRRTGAEIVVTVMRVSDRYPLYPIVWAAVGAIISTAFLGLLFPRLALRSATLVQALVLLGLTIVFDWMPVRMRLVPRHTRHSLAHALARREFGAHAMAGEPGRRVVLLFVSLAEHYVEVIADRTTDQAAPEGAWEALVADFTRAAQSGRLADALVDAVQRCGAVLDTHPSAATLESPA